MPQSDSTAHLTIEPLDFAPALLAEFCRLTGRMMASSADYALANDWESTGIPLSIAVRGVEAKCLRAVGKRYLRTMPLSWCEPDVIDEFTNWRRAVGPHVAAQYTRNDRLAP